MRVPPGDIARGLLAAAALALTAATARSEEPGPFGGLLPERPKLTGDWYGARPTLRDHGVTVDASATQYYQGVAAGGLSRSFPYGGRNDYFLHLDGEKLGWWDGFSVDLHGETRYGRSANLLTGALSPVNELLLVPGSSGTVSGLTGVTFTQALSDRLSVYAGKVNTNDDIRQPLTGAAIRDGFLNTSLLLNPILERTFPYSTFGAGVDWLRDGEPVFSLAVFDANDTPATTGFESFFDNGVVLYGHAGRTTGFFGRPGHVGLEGTYSTGRYTNVQASSYYTPLGGLAFASPPKAGSWALGLEFDQAVVAAADDPDRVWGVFGRLGIADGNPNPVRWSAAAGVAGASPIPGRPHDTFGVGWYYLGISDVLKRSARPLTPLGDEQGVELYYNARLTPWCRVTPDLQVVDPIQQQARPAFVLGLRARVDF